ncbi:MAG: acyltransferase family protein [Omnitrophica WOR_2 bacterium]
MNILPKFLKIETLYENRVFGLDLMRALAIIFVVIGHGSMLERADTNFPWIKLIDGVELFFVLSGFLIGGILLKIFHKDSFGFQSLKSFWIRRWFRTLPNYYLILVVNIIVVYFGFNHDDIHQFNWKFFFFLQNFSNFFTGFFWESWSLSIEEWFYILFPIILLLIFFVLKPISKNRNQMFVIAIVIFLFLSLLLRLTIASKYTLDDFWLSNKVYKVVIFRLDGIALGLLAAIIKSKFSLLWTKSRYITFVLGIGLSYFILYSIWPSNDFSTKVYKILFQGLGCFLLLPFFDSLKQAPMVFLKPITHISLISYSMYLINLGLISSVIKANIVIENEFQAWLLYGIYWFSVIFFSTILYKYFEKPVMDLRERMIMKSE